MDSNPSGAVCGTHQLGQWPTTRRIPIPTGPALARPDATIAQQLKRNQAGMLVHEFPDGLSEGGWIHNRMPMRVAEGEMMYYGEPSTHPRQSDGQSEP